MVKTLAAFSVLVLLPACAAAPDWFPFALRTPGQDRSEHSLAEFSFEWELSGSREVAPLQIFDDGQRTWLQFTPQQPVPAIFELAPEGVRPLPYTRENPYIVLPGVWPQLMFRGGALQSLAKRTRPIAALTTPATSEPTALVASEGVLAIAPMQDEPSAVQVLPSGALSEINAPESMDPVLVQHYEVSPRDITLRAALAKWAGTAGWTFEPEHWALDVDIPIVGSASFALPFKQAVQELVASTELADRPLQPCFYSNRVLRVVPYAQSCNRTAGPVRAS